MQTFNDISTEELLKMLAFHREMADSNKFIMGKIIEEAKALPSYKDADQNAKSETAMVEALTAEIKSRAIGEYLGSGNKKPYPGVTVKVFRTFMVNSQEIMEAWVEKNLAAAVKKVFDMDVIKTFAKTNPIPGTDLLEDIRAEIASKLP